MSKADPNYPRMMFSKNGYTIVQSEEEEAALGAGWSRDAFATAREPESGPLPKPQPQPEHDPAEAADYKRWSIARAALESARKPLPEPQPPPEPEQEPEPEHEEEGEKPEEQPQEIRKTRMPHAIKKTRTPHAPAAGKRTRT